MKNVYSMRHKTFSLVEEETSKFLFRKKVSEASMRQKLVRAGNPFSYELIEMVSGELWNALE